MQILIAAIAIILASLYVILLDHLALSSRGLQRSLVLPVLILLFIFYRASKKSTDKPFDQYGKVMMFFWGTILVQMLVVATGGLQSPFLILIHLYMIGTSFIFSFPIALVFLFVSFGTLFA